MTWFRPEGWEPIIQFWIAVFCLWGLVALVLSGQDDEEPFVYPDEEVSHDETEAHLSRVRQEQVSDCS